MRIIAGTAGGVRLEYKKGGPRATLERVKESYFNAIHFAMQGAQALDLFAGSGQLGLEALSRGAAHAVFVDASAECVQIIRRNAEKCGFGRKCTVALNDWRQYVNEWRRRGGGAKFDVIFLDPPFGEIPIDEVLEKVVGAGMISNGGLLVCESEKAVEWPGYTAKHYKYGKIFISILRKDVEVDG